MNKINFTAEHEAQLKSLFVELGFNGKVLSGKFGANSYTTWQLLHQTSIPTLKTLKRTLKKEIEILEEQDEWSFSSYQAQRANETKQWYDFIHLLIGYNKHKEALSDKNAKIAKAKAELAEMQEEAKTPAERIADKLKEIEELEK